MAAVSGRRQLALQVFALEGYVVLMSVSDRNGASRATRRGWRTGPAGKPCASPGTWGVVVVTASP